MIGPWIRLLRPLQWLKNLACLAALVFAGQLDDPQARQLALQAFVVFCLLSGSVYALNDILDRDRDRSNPRTRHRPLAAGEIRPGAALTLALLLAATAACLAAPLAPAFHRIAMGYLLLMVAYSVFLKHLVVLDVLTIATGFSLRVQAGIEVLGAPQSAWILECSFSLSLFLALAKRRAEFETLRGPESRQGRPALAGYSREFLDRAVAIAATLTLVSYALYSVLVQRSTGFALTYLPVLYGTLRYLLLASRRAGTEAPETVLVTDLPILFSVLLWIAMCVFALYARPMGAERSAG